MAAKVKASLFYLPTLGNRAEIKAPIAGLQSRALPADAARNLGAGAARRRPG
jgi:hypothetical protein